MQAMSALPVASVIDPRVSGRIKCDAGVCPWEMGITSLLSLKTQRQAPNFTKLGRSTSPPPSYDVSALRQSEPDDHRNPRSGSLGSSRVLSNKAEGHLLGLGPPLRCRARARFT